MMLRRNRALLCAKGARKHRSHATRSAWPPVRHRPHDRPPASISKASEPTSGTAGFPRTKAICAASLPGALISSASCLAIQSPRASSSPRFNVATRPMFFSFRRIRIRGSPNAARISADESDDPSSMARSSKSQNRCRSTLSRDCRRCFSALKTGIKTVTAGALIACGLEESGRTESRADPPISYGRTMSRPRHGPPVKRRRGPP